MCCLLVVPIHIVQHLWCIMWPGMGARIGGDGLFMAGMVAGCLPAGCECVSLYVCCAGKLHRRPCSLQRIRACLSLDLLGGELIQIITVCRWPTGAALVQQPAPYADLQVSHHQRFCTAQPRLAVTLSCPRLSAFAHFLLASHVVRCAGCRLLPGCCCGGCPNMASTQHRQHGCGHPVLRLDRAC